MFIPYLSRQALEDPAPPGKVMSCHLASFACERVHSVQCLHAPLLEATAVGSFCLFMFRNVRYVPCCVVPTWGAVQLLVYPCSMRRRSGYVVIIVLSFHVLCGVPTSASLGGHLKRASESFPRSMGSGAPAPTSTSPGARVQRRLHNFLPVPRAVTLPRPP